MVDENVIDKNILEQDAKNQGFIGSLLDKVAQTISEYPNVVRTVAAVASGVAGVFTAGVGGAIAGAVLGAASEGIIKVSNVRHAATMKRRASMSDLKNGHAEKEKSKQKEIAPEVGQSVNFVQEASEDVVSENLASYDLSEIPSVDVDSPVALKLDNHQQNIQI